MSGKMSNESVRDWLAAREVIAGAIREWFPYVAPEKMWAYADAIQARLAHEQLLIAYSDRIAWKDD